MLRALVKVQAGVSIQDWIRKILVLHRAVQSEHSLMAKILARANAPSGEKGLARTLIKYKII